MVVLRNDGGLKEALHTAAMRVSPALQKEGVSRCIRVEGYSNCKEFDESSEPLWRPAWDPPNGPPSLLAVTWGWEASPQRIRLLLKSHVPFTSNELTAVWYHRERFSTWSRPWHGEDHSLLRVYMASDIHTNVQRVVSLCC